MTTSAIKPYLAIIVAVGYTGKISASNSVHPASLLARLWSPAVVISCILIVTLVRII